jgi:TPR repeat protein
MTYAEGLQGVARNEKLAFEWMFRSAQQGYKKALALMAPFSDRKGIGTHLKSKSWNRTRKRSIRHLTRFRSRLMTTEMRAMHLEFGDRLGHRLDHTLVASIH